MSKVTEITELKQMNEIELFIALLDEKMTDNILKGFNDPVPGFNNPSLTKKKDHLLNIFKRKTTKSRRSKEDPFIRAIKPMIIENLEKIKEEDFFFALADLDSVPDYVKLANAFYYHRNALRDRLSEIMKRFNNNEQIFKFEEVERTDEEAKEYFRTIIRYADSKGITLLYNDIFDLFTPEEKDSIRELQKKVGMLSFGQFQKEQLKYKKDFSEELLYFTYGYTHLNEDPDILHVIAVQVLKKMLTLNKEKYEETAKSLQTLEKELQETKAVILRGEERLDEIRKLRDELKDYRRKNLTLQGEKIQLENQLLKTIQDLKIARKTIELEAQNTDKKIKELDKQKEKLEVEKENLQAELVRIRSYYESLWEEFSSTPSPSFAVIYVMDTKLFEIIFPEIRAIHLPEWKKKKETFLGKEITKLYVQRDGLPTKVLNEIRQIARKYNIEVDTFFARSQKELLEAIGSFKCKERN